jgi:hypothetical protein
MRGVRKAAIEAFEGQRSAGNWLTSGLQGRRLERHDPRRHQSGSLRRHDIHTRAPQMKTDEKPRLKLANENPWYCLATLYGEQKGEQIDHVLLKRNRDGWDHWRSGRNEAINAAFAARLGTSTSSLPDPTQPADFTFTHFEARSSFWGTIQLKPRTSVRLSSRTTLTSQR